MMRALQEMMSKMTDFIAALISQKVQAKPLKDTKGGEDIMEKLSLCGQSKHKAG